MTYAQLTLDGEPGSVLELIVLAIFYSREDMTEHETAQEVLITLAAAGYEIRGVTE